MRIYFFLLDTGWPPLFGWPSLLFNTLAATRHISWPSPQSAREDAPCRGDRGRFPTGKCCTKQEN